MRAVPVAVQRIRVRHGRCLGRIVGARVVVVADEVEPADDLVAELVLAEHRVELVGRVERVRRSGAAEHGVGVVDAGVEHRNRDAVAGEATCPVPHGRHVHVLSRGGVVELEDARDLHALDARELPELIHLRGRDNRRDAVVGVLEAKQHVATQRGDPSGDCVLPLLQLRTDRALLRLRQHRAGPGGRGHPLGDGCALQLEDDTHLAAWLQRGGLEVCVVARAEQSGESLGRGVGERADAACVRRRTCSGACCQDDCEQAHGEERGSPCQTTSHMPLSLRLCRRACRGGRTPRNLADDSPRRNGRFSEVLPSCGSRERHRGLPRPRPRPARRPAATARWRRRR